MEATLKKILLATDGSEDAALAAGAAAHLSKKVGAELYIAHAWRPQTQQASYPAVVWTNYAHLYEREARKVLASQVDAVEALGSSVEEARLLRGTPIDAILDLCKEIEPGLVVVGSRGLGPLRRILIGSVSEGIVHHAHCPVLVVRGGEEAWPPERVVIGDGGSDGSGRATELAASIGGVCGADVVLVRAYRHPPEPIGGWSAEDRRRLDEARLREVEALEKRAKGLREASGSRLQTRVTEGDAALALLTVAEETNEHKTLVAVDSRGLGALRRVRLGSVSTNVLRAAGGPVLICPPRRETAMQAGHAAARSARAVEVTP